MAEEDIGTIWTDSVKQALTLAGSCPDPIVILGTTSVISEVEQIFSNLNLPSPDTGATMRANRRISNQPMKTLRRKEKSHDRYLRNR